MYKTYELEVKGNIGYTGCDSGTDHSHQLRTACRINTHHHIVTAVFTDDKQTREENIRNITAKLEEAFADNEEWLAILGEAGMAQLVYSCLALPHSATILSMNAMIVCHVYPGTNPDLQCMYSGASFRAAEAGRPEREAAPFPPAHHDRFHAFPAPWRALSLPRSKKGNCSGAYISCCISVSEEDCPQDDPEGSQEA